MSDLNAFPQYADCMLCDDKGLVDPGGVFRFCGCPAGQRRALVDPTACDSANETRAKMAKLGAAE